MYLYIFLKLNLQCFRGLFFFVHCSILKGQSTFYALSNTVNGFEYAHVVLILTFPCGYGIFFIISSTHVLIALYLATSLLLYVYTVFY